MTADSSNSTAQTPWQNLIEVAQFFLKLGVTAFGGPAAHIAMMHDELVKRRKWLNEQQFLDLLGATNLIPGPNSTEMTIHLGFVRARWPGLIVGGVCFITPAALITLVLAWAYVQFGTIPAVGGLLYGVKPVIIAIIVQALWALGQKAVKSSLTAVVGLLTLALYFWRFNEILLLIAGGLVVMVGQNWQQRHKPNLTAFLALLPGLNKTTEIFQYVCRRGEAPTGRSLALLRENPSDLPRPYHSEINLWFCLGLPPLAVSTPVSLLQLFLTFLKIGSVLYGSGYVLLAFLRADFVTRLGWLTDQQLVDAIAIGQVTPGPVFTTATFIGYVLAGVPGALLATLGIFLPSFVFVALSNPFVPRLRNSPWTGSLLDGVNVASLGLMAAVTWQLGWASLVDPLTIILALVSAVLLLRFQINSTWLIVAGALVGLVATGANFINWPLNNRVIFWSADW